MYSSKLLLSLLLASITLICGCSKDNNEPDPVDPGLLELQQHVQVIDSTLMSVDYNASDISTGLYVFNTTGTPPAIQVNDVIVGAQGEGFIRIVSSVSVNGTVVTLQTTQGTMEDVFKNGNFNFTIDMNDMNPGKTSAFTYSVANEILYQNGPVSIELENGSVSIDPNWFFDFTFTPAEGITNFEMSTNNSSISTSAKVKVTASQAVNLFDDTDTIATYTKTVTRFILVGVVPVPVVVKIYIDYIGHYVADLDAAISSTATFNASATGINLGVKYSENQWQSIYAMNPSGNFDVTTPEGEASLTLKYSWTPVVSVKLYGVVGPYVSSGLMTELTGRVTSPSLDWDLHAEAWVKTIAGFNINLGPNAENISILGEEISLNQDFRDSVETTPYTFDTPWQIQETSGNNQTGATGLPLTNPLKVKVLSSLGLPQKNVPVYFNITSGGGTLNHPSILTDQSGYAEAIWTLGATQGGQTVEVKAKNGTATIISGSPVEFTAINNSLCNGTLEVSESRSGKTITASATGGTPPYQFKFVNGPGQAFSSDATFDLISNGNYSVIVKDVNGCTDTVVNCINDVAVSVTCVASDTVNEFPAGNLRITYTSALGLLPEFVMFFGSDYILGGYLVTGGNIFDSNMPDYCLQSGYSVPALTFWGSTGTDNNRTLSYNVPNGVNPLGSSNLSIVLKNDCSGTSLCPSGPENQSTLWSQNYNFTW